MQFTIFGFVKLASSLGFIIVATSFYLVFEYVDHDLMGLLDSQLVDPSELQVASLMVSKILSIKNNNLETIAVGSKLLPYERISPP